MNPADVKINYLTFIKDLYRDLISRDKSVPCYNLTASSVAEPTELLLNHIEQGLSREQLEKTDPWYHTRLVEKISRIEGVLPENILLANGASGALFLVCSTVLEKGSHAIVEYPCYEPLMAVPEFLGAELNFLPRKPENNFQIDPNELDSIMSERTKLILLTNLHNPSGAHLRDDELMRILEIARKHNSNVRVLVDEVYHRFIDKSIPPAAKLDEGFISINSLSKVYGLYIVRCGWIVADRDFIDNVLKVFVLIENIGSPLNESISHGVFENLDAHNRYSESIVTENREILKEAIQPLFEESLLEGNIPSHGCIAFPRLIGIRDTRPFVQELAEKQHVFIVPGIFFGSPQHVRIGFGGKPDILREGLERFGHQLRQK